MIDRRRRNIIVSLIKPLLLSTFVTATTTTMRPNNNRKHRSSAAAAAIVLFLVWGVTCSTADVGPVGNHHHSRHIPSISPPPPPRREGDVVDSDLTQRRQPPTSRRDFSGPLARGLSVVGGSKLRRTARRIRKFREVRANNRYSTNTPLEERVPHDTTTVVRTTRIQPPPYRPRQNQQQGQQHTMHSSTIQPEHPSRASYPQHHQDVTQDQQQQQQELKIRYEEYIASPQHESPKSTSIRRPIVQDQSSGNSKMAIIYMSLLAVQFGIQPMLVSKFAPRGICKSSVVLTQEVCKGAIAYWAYKRSTTTEQRRKEVGALSIKSWLTMAGVPAALYTVQNLAALLAYQNLEALTFNVLNQTKVLTSALCCYLIMGKKQSTVQALSLILLCMSALVIEKILSFQSIASALSFLGTRSATAASSSSLSFDTLKSMAMGSRRFTHGVIPVLLASFISGLAGALTQKNLQGVSSSSSSSSPNNKVKTTRAPKNAYLFSMELTAASVAVLLMSLFFTADGRRIVENGFFDGWTAKVLIPILTNSIGGILVGLVTKHAGSVRKGFALIFGLLLSGVIQASGSAGVSQAQIVGGLLAGGSLWLHSSYPSKSGKK